MMILIERNLIGDGALIKVKGDWISERQDTLRRFGLYHFERDALNCLAFVMTAMMIGHGVEGR